jgi:uncharacterized membrane protein
MLQGATSRMRRTEGTMEKDAQVRARKDDPHKDDHSLLHELRAIRRIARHKRAASHGLTFGQRVADAVAATIGSWTFIILQSVLLAIWIVLNVTAYVRQWDPYPFILLNLALSFQAAYAAPVIMMSQNRQQEIDRRSAEHDYQINIKAELEIELLHQKIDALRETEVLRLTEAVRELAAQLGKR